jgi:hypothetical protein
VPQYAVQVGVTMSVTACRDSWSGLGLALTDSDLANYTQHQSPSVFSTAVVYTT